MGWLGGVSSTTNQTASNQNQYGTRTPILSPQYNSIFNAYAKTLGFDPSQWSGSTYGTAQAPYTQANGVAGATGATPGATNNGIYGGPRADINVNNSENGGGSQPTGYTGPNPQVVTGYNPTQTGAVNWMANNLTNNPVNGQTGSVNADLQNYKNYMTSAAAPLTSIANQAAPQAGLSTSADPKQAAAFMSAYESPYTNQVVDTTLANYDQNTNNQLNALRSQRGAGSAFGDRANISDSQFLNQSDLNRAQTEAGLRNLGFTNAIAPSVSDAANSVGNTQFNANAANQNAQFNVNAQQTNTAQRMQAIQQTQATLAAETGLDQTILQNVVTANGINTEAAQNLFNAGTISQAQLNALLDAASGTNGSQFAQNSNETSRSNTFKVDTGTII